MDIKKCIKGEKSNLPLSSIGVDREGWVKAHSPSNGILITLRGQERASGGCLVPETELGFAGYVDVDVLCGLFSKLTNKELQVIAKKIGVGAGHRRKEDLLKAILKCH